MFKSCKYKEEYFCYIVSLIFTMNSVIFIEITTEMHKEYMEEHFRVLFKSCKSTKFRDVWVGWYSYLLNKAASRSISCVPSDADIFSKQLLTIYLELC